MCICRDTKDSRAKSEGNSNGKGRVKKETAYLSIAHNIWEETAKGSRSKSIDFAYS